MSGHVRRIQRIFKPRSSAKIIAWAGSTIASLRSAASAMRPSTREPRKSAPSSLAPVISVFLKLTWFQQCAMQIAAVKIGLSEIARAEFACLELSKSKLCESGVPSEIKKSWHSASIARRPVKRQFTNSARWAFNPITSAFAKSHSIRRTSFNLKLLRMHRVKLSCFKRQVSKTTDWNERSLNMTFSTRHFRNEISGSASDRQGNLLNVCRNIRRGSAPPVFYFLPGVLRFHRRFISTGKWGCSKQPLIAFENSVIFVHIRDGWPLTDESPTADILCPSAF